jgi:hypothetical protein
MLAFNIQRFPARRQDAHLQNFLENACGYAIRRNSRRLTFTIRNAMSDVISRRLVARSILES